IIRQSMVSLEMRDNGDLSLHYGAFFGINRPRSSSESITRKSVFSEPIQDIRSTIGRTRNFSARCNLQQMESPVAKQERDTLLWLLNWTQRSGIPTSSIRRTCRGQSELGTCHSWR